MFKATLSDAIGFPIFGMDAVEFVHVNTLAVRWGITPAELTERALAGRHRNNLHRSGDNLFLPIDAAWSIQEGYRAR
jgi:hypothetical protein